MAMPPSPTRGCEAAAPFNVKIEGEKNKSVRQALVLLLRHLPHLSECLSNFVGVYGVGGIFKIRLQLLRGLVEFLLAQIEIEEVFSNLQEILLPQLQGAGKRSLRAVVIRGLYRHHG